VNKNVIADLVWFGISIFHSAMAIPKDSEGLGKTKIITDSRHCCFHICFRWKTERTDPSSPALGLARHIPICHADPFLKLTTYTIARDRHPCHHFRFCQNPEQRANLGSNARPVALGHQTLP
jgi:hypothetical protein